MVGLSFCSVSAQTNNLYFNPVILVGLTTMTVPANKVWKIEGFLQNGYYGSNIVQLAVPLIHIMDFM